MATTISKERLAELLARARATAAITTNAVSAHPDFNSLPATPISVQAEGEITTEDKYGNLITYNSRQQQFVSLATTNKSCVLIGAAGTGKTTCMRGVLEHILSSPNPHRISDPHKHLELGAPGIVVTAFTRRAVSNIRRVVPEDMKGNCITIHKLLEFAPIYFEVFNELTGKLEKTMRFEPTRNQYHPLDRNIHTIVIEEASMPSVELFSLLLAALSHPVQFIFLGDIQQLPPVFGSAILGYKMLELPTIELTEVYRQALESPIIRLAHRILSGQSIPFHEFPEWKFPGQLTIREWTKRVSPEIGLLTAAKFFTTAIEANAFDVDEDVILIPFNKAFGTDELNKHIAQFISRRDKKLTYEVIAGWNKHYFAVGDKILVDKEDAIITAIVPNMEYVGKTPHNPNVFLDRWGHLDKELAGEKAVEYDVTAFALEDVDHLLEKMAATDEDSERIRAASHRIYYRYAYEISSSNSSSEDVDTDSEDSGLYMDSAAEINTTILAYAITVHKSQGSEWKKVFLLLHQSHNTMLQRELLYTAITRAKEELYIICEKDSLEKGINSQKIKGNTLAEKAEFFKGKIESNERQNPLNK